MAPEVIDLISSSPPNSGRLAPSYSRHVQPPITRRLDPLSNDFLFLSDDFDSSIEIDEPVLVDATGTKRKLQTQQEDKRSVKRASPAPALPPVRTSGNPRACTLDPIDLASSPAPDETIARVTPGNSTDWNPGSRLPPQRLDPDPFASSPQPQARTTELVLSDPFASSPQLQHDVASKSKPSELFGISRTVDAATEPILTRAALSDPFASSPNMETDTGLKPARPVHLGETTVSNRRPRGAANWDPISSSAPETRSFESPPRQNPVVIDIEDSDPDNSEEEFPDISSFDIEKCRRSQLQRSQSEVTTSRSRKTNAQKSAEQRKKERDAKVVAKELDKENKRREKEEAKAARARDKERTAALAEVNKLRTDKKVSTPEMLVDIPSSLNPTTTTQLEALLEGLDVQFTTWESPVENVVKWRRKVRSKYNDDLGLWEPIPLYIGDENHALVVLTADEFVKLALEDGLEAHVDKMKRHFSSYEIIYLLEGVTPWMRKNRNLRNRQFASHVRSQDQISQPARRRPDVSQEYVPEETIEDALLQLQFIQDVLIHHTTIPLETAQWIAIFTQHVSTIPYRKQRDQATVGAGFCMESGQVKTGEDAKDTYVRMLQEIVRVTAPIAYGIAAEFANVSNLVRALEAEGSNVLEGVRKSANKEGAFSDRTVGQAVSRRMHKVFTGRDQGSTDV